MKLPTEVWALSDGDAEEHWLIPPIDDDGTDVFMAYSSEEEARIGAAYQKKMYDVNCKPIRLLPPVAAIEAMLEFSED